MTSTGGLPFAAAGQALTRSQEARALWAATFGRRAHPIRACFNDGTATIMHMRAARQRPLSLAIARHPASQIFFTPKCANLETQRCTRQL